MEGPALKRPRLSLACNTCRLRKVKCDADYPRCRNCRIRNQECITSHPRRPNESVVRQWIEAPEKPPKGTAKTLVQHASPTHPSPSPRSHSSAEKACNADGEHQPLHEGISPVHQQLEPLFNTDHGTNRTKIVGGSSSQGLMRSLDVYFRAARLQPVSGLFLHGMKHAEEMPIPIGMSLPDLPDAPLRDRYLTTYLERIHPLYPIFNIVALKDTITQLSTLSSFKDASSEQAPSLASVYLIMALGANEGARRVTADGEHYVRAAASLLGHIILVPYLPTVQALLLYTIAYRGRNSEGLAWQTLGMAIRIAYTLGIHRHTMNPSAGNKHSSHPAASPTHLLEARIWAVCYSLEKVMQLDSGRPTVIIEPVDCDRLLPLDARPENNLLRWHLGLADYQGQISQHIYGIATKSRTSRQLLEDTARLDQALLSWANTIPPETRPGNDLFCSRDIYHIAAFLSILYHATMIALHRAALIAPNATFEAEVDKTCPEGPSRFRIRGGESICANSARSIAKLSIELSDQGINTMLLPAGIPLLACIVLAIYLMKHPDGGLHAADLQLLKACLELCSRQFTECKSDTQFVSSISVFYERISRYLQSQSKPEHLPVCVTPSADDSCPRENNAHLRSNSFPQSPSAINRSAPSSIQRNTQSGLSDSTIAAQERANTSGICQTQLINTQRQNSNKQHAYMFEDIPLSRASHAPSGYGNSFFHNNDSFHSPFDGYNVENLWDWMLSFDPEDLGSLHDMLK